MAATKPRTSSFSRNFSSAHSSKTPGFKHGPNGTTFISSGIPDLDSTFSTIFISSKLLELPISYIWTSFNFSIFLVAEILCGGFPLGSLVLVMEDAEAPHHMLLLRNFMSQGLVHDQPLLYASPSRDPRGFLGTLPSPGASKDDKSRDNSTEQEKGLRIAWQYKKYFGDDQESANAIDSKYEFCNDFDLRRPFDRHFFSGKHVECVSILDSSSLSTLRDRCATFLSQVPRFQRFLRRLRSL